MDQSVVDEVEEGLALAIADAFKRWRSNGRLPMTPDEQLVHRMAEAATTVYEAVADRQETRRHRPPN